VDSFGLMPQETARATVDHIFADLEAGDRLTLAFQGGEPTLAGLDYFRQIVQAVEAHRAQGVQVSYALQTNGLLLDEGWCAFCRAHGVLVGLSLDGPATFHDANRVDGARRGTFQRVMAAKERLERHGVDYNVLMVLTRQLARHPQQVWQFLEKQQIPFVQFIPCLGPLEGTESPQSLTPERYAQFYLALFEQWDRACQRGDFRSVKLFDDLVALLAFGVCNACGLTGRCLGQLIVEADGGVYPCDFYVLDPYRAGSLQKQSLREVYEAPAMHAFRNRPRELPTQCPSCPYWAICGGGCPRMREAVFCDPVSGLCGHRLFLDGAMGRLRQIAAQVRRRGIRR
jgi:uncharacterized protein